MGTINAKEKLVKAIISSSPRYKPLAKTGEFPGMLYSVWKMLSDTSEGTQSTLAGGQLMDANNIGFQDWVTMKRICQITEAFDEDAQSEGFRFSFDVCPSLEGIKLPDCDCSTRGYEISETRTIRGNSYDVNADTYATQLGIKARTMFLFWINELGQYGVIQQEYWCL